MLILFPFVDDVCRRVTILAKGALIALVLGAWGHGAQAADTIKVGVYRFPPFVDFNSSGLPEGLTIDVLKRLNDIQNDYRFEAVLTSPRTRYADFSTGQFDAMFFENADWGWKQRHLPVSQTEEFMSGGERYIALVKPGRSQSYFDDLSNKTIAGITGYHYGFANFEDDPNYLRKQFRARLVRIPDDLFLVVLAGHADIAVVTESLLYKKIKLIPGLKSSILISNRYDQIYSHCVLLRNGMMLSVDDMSILMKKLTADPAYMALIEDYREKP